MSTDFSMYAGDDKLLTVTVTDEDGDAVDLTSATIKWQAAKSYGKSSAIEKDTTGGISITDASGGVFQVTLSDTDTEDLSGNYVHEAEVTFADGSIATVLQGTMNIKPVVIEAT